MEPFVIAVESAKFDWSEGKKTINEQGGEERKMEPFVAVIWAPSILTIGEWMELQRHLTDHQLEVVPK